MAHKLVHDLKSIGFEADMRRNSFRTFTKRRNPTAYDRILATQFGVKAFEMVMNEEYGKMVCLSPSQYYFGTFKEAIDRPNFVDPNCDMVKTAKGVGISFGD